MMRSSTHYVSPFGEGGWAKLSPLYLFDFLDTIVVDDKHSDIYPIQVVLGDSP
jgi:hypothetical protein